MKKLIILSVLLLLPSFIYAETYRVSIDTKTSKMIESQSGGTGQKDLNVLINNAVNSGYKKEDVIVKYVTEQEYKELMKITEGPFDPDKITEKMIYEKLRSIAISELKKEGKHE